MGKKPASKIRAVAAAESKTHYGIVRGGGRHDYWQVSLGRQRRLIVRSFFDGIYGGRDEALAVAKAFRDAVMAAIPPRTFMELSAPRRSSNTSGFTGVHAVKRHGEIVAWEAMIENQGKLKRKSFSLSEYGEKAKEKAIALRKEWVEAAEISFYTRNDLATATAAQHFPEFLENRSEAMRMSDDEIDARVAKINSEFDAKRPLWVNVRVNLSEGKRLQLYVSDSGWPARMRQTDKSLHKHSLGAALAILRAEAAQIIGDFFGEHLRECFLVVHGTAFNVEQFDSKEGITIHELPDTLRERMAENPDGQCEQPLNFETWTTRWSAQSWLENRPFWSRPDDSLYAIARSLAETAYQKSPRNPFKQSTKTFRKTENHREAGIGVYRRDNAWTINITRQGRKIVRCFSDVNFLNGTEEAMRQAMAYRDAVIEMLPQPPGAQKRKISKANSTGTPGIFRVTQKGVMVGWRATFNSIYFGSKTALFKIADHGEEGAKVLAIAQRQKWVDEIPATATNSDPSNWEPLTDEEFARHLANLDKRFGCGLSAKSRRRVEEAVS